MAEIKRALISVSDKTGILPLAQNLAELGVEILSTGGTASLLKENHIAVMEIQDYTGFPEMMDGRLKTLHPRVHGGLLARRDRPDDQEAMASQGIAPIDLLVVNLYPFETTVAREDCTLAQAIEQIDIGGPAMLRAAAKNHAFVSVVVDPNDYPKILEEMRTKGGSLAEKTRFALAVKAFEHTARYDGAIASYLGGFAPGEATREPNKSKFPDTLNRQYRHALSLRYGENPHQAGAFYRDSGEPVGLAAAQQLQGKELSYNNLADLDAAYRVVTDFSGSACVIVKHGNPSGVAVAADTVEAYRRAFACDPMSAFGGIIAFNRPLDKATAEALLGQFLEAVIAPEITPEAAELFTKKSKVRLLRAPAQFDKTDLEIKRVWGGVLVQDSDALLLEESQLKVASAREPSVEEWQDLRFAWTVARHVRSNAIVYAKEGRTLGIGAGQMSRVDAARIGVLKAQDAGLDLTGCALASDAFFPFRDGVDAAAQAGVTAVIQPGGSMRDEEVIASANEHGIAMVFTGIRHFKH